MKKTKSNISASEFPAITVLNSSDLLEKPSPLPTAAAVRSLVKKLGIHEIKVPYVWRPGFVLNSYAPVAPGKASLVVPVNKYVEIQKSYKPYYYLFNQWPFANMMPDAVWGKVIIHFQPGFLAQNGFVFIRVSGILDPNMGRGYHISDGITTSFIQSLHGPNDYGQTVPQTICVYMRQSLNLNVMRDITITSRFACWKLFDVTYNPFSIVR